MRAPLAAVGALLMTTCPLVPTSQVNAQSLDDHPNTDVLSETEVENDFVRTRTCGGPEGNPCREGFRPIPLEWADRRVEYRIFEAGSADFHPDQDTITDDLKSAVIDTFETWNEPDCSDFLLDPVGLTSTDYIGYDSDRSDNENIVIWRDEAWPYSGQAVGIATVVYNANNGEIFSGDIELNTADHEFTDNDDDVKIDLRNTLTHEVGHLLGLDHSLTQPAATMWFSAQSGETYKRELHEADIAGLCYIYPEGEESDLKRQQNGSSRCAAIATSPAQGLPMLVALMAIVLFRHRREPT